MIRRQTSTLAALAIVFAGVAARGEEAAPSRPERFWTFQPLVEPAVPSVREPAAVRTMVDAFILARLEQKSLQLSPEAERLALLRRVSFDLVGLPPSPEEIQAFESDVSEGAYERLVDRLLASPHFGERWGRHWLDAAGYSDITGGDNDAGIIKLSEGKWKYRDWVVRAFNQDKPYERFLIEQLAGDELVDWRKAESFTPEIQDLLVATGFLRSAADDTDEKELTTQDILHAVLQRTGEVLVNNLLGLTLACAKCHDHKYEPIPQQDYYRLMATLTPTFNPQSWVQPKNRALADIPPAQKAQAEAHNAELDRQIAELKKQQTAIRQPHEARLFAARLERLPEAIRADVKLAHETPAAKRNEVQKYLAEKFSQSLTVDNNEVQQALSEDEKKSLADFQRKTKELNDTRRAWGTIQAAYDVGAPPATFLLRRGNHETPGETVEPGFFSALGRNGPAGRFPLQPVGETSGRRLAFAQWLTDWRSPAGGLTARVMVNRVWQQLFGRGIVETSENMGVSGTAASHPELLDWLACHFVAEGRQLKPLVKLLVTSSVYRQSSHRSQPPESDPANRLLSHMPLRRLQAEIVRDAILSVSGQLDPRLGGPALPVEVRPDGLVVIQEKNLPSPAAKARRSLYVLARRNYHLSMLGVFDQPTMTMNCPNRQQSAVVLQSLTMLNDDFVLEQAGLFAERVEMSQPGASRAEQIASAFRIALGRGPSPRELAWSEQLLAEQAADYAAEKLPNDQIAHKSWTHLCHMLLGSNEFLYVP